LRATLGVPVGLSDHSTHPFFAAAAAVARGACVIEKHFTLDRNLPGPDHSYALEPGELKTLVEAVRNIEQALGSTEKTVRDVESELTNYRRSIFTTRAVEAGQRFTRDNLAILRRTGSPDTGLAPKRFDDVLGKSAAADLEAWHPLGPDDVAEEPA
jgi:N,N'-diacetyllegionaminate synthase